MSPNYSFEFPGTRDMFLAILDQYPNNDHKFYYFDDYIVEISGNNFYFGVQRGGHSAGYWFKPTITEIDNKLFFQGSLRSISILIHGIKNLKGCGKTLCRLLVCCFASVLIDPRNIYTDQFIY